jgi:hypothetical protein
LARGINVTNWFRFPTSRDPAALAGYVGDRALADIRMAGFDFVRLAVDPDVIASPSGRAALIAVLKRIQRQNLAVVVSPHPLDWNLEADAGRLSEFWHDLAPALQPLDPVLTVPEILNEPVFPGDPALWDTVQHHVFQIIRAALPDATVVLTGRDWGSIGGLLEVTPESDPNVVYSFHLYDPVELTSLAAWRTGVNRADLARLPFPVADTGACLKIGDSASDAVTAAMMHYYCRFGWDDARMGATIGRAADWARLHHARLLAGEFGATAALNRPARLAWLKTVRDGFETRGIGWALWGYDDVMGFAVPRPPGPHPVLDPRILSALGLSPRL